MLLDVLRVVPQELDRRHTSLTWLVSLVVLAASCHGTDSGSPDREASDSGGGGSDATSSGDGMVGGSSGGSGSGVISGDGSNGSESGANEILCTISSDGGIGSSCECVGASPPHTLPNDVPCGPTVLAPAALCCGPSAWPIPGSSCFCFPWGCNAATGSSQVECACNVEGDASYGSAASCSPSGSALCCSAGTACSCGATPCSMLGSDWVQVPNCDLSHLASSACQSVGHGPAQLATCR